MSDWHVPLTDIAMTEEDVQAVLDCLRVGLADDGPADAGASSRRSRTTSARPHAVTVSSGTAALHLACLAAGLGPGDEVIVPAFTFVASAARRALRRAPSRCSATSSARSDLNLDAADVARRITPRTKAVMAVHFCGYPADVQALRELCDEHGLVLIEDCAQAIGARVDDERAPGRHRRRARRVQLLLQEAAVRGRGRHGRDRRRGAGRARAPAALARDDERHLGSPPRPRPRLRHRRRRLQLPHRRAARRARAQPPRTTGGRHRGAPRSWCAPTASTSPEWPAWSCRSTSDAVERSSHFAFPVLLADRETRDRFRDALKADGMQTTWYPALHTLHRVPHARAHPAASRTRSEVADRHCALPLSSTMDEAKLEMVVEAVRAAVA